MNSSEQKNIEGFDETLEAIKAFSSVEPQPELLIFPGELVASSGAFKPHESRLAYHVLNYAEGVFVDALDGRILYRYGTLQGADVVREGGGLPIIVESGYPTVALDGVPLVAPLSRS